MTAADTLVPLPAPRQTPYGTLRAAPFVGDKELPAEIDVVVIGGGINGTATAYNLAKRGAKVLLCEKAEIGCESSSRAFGWVMELTIPTVLQPLTQLSKKLWRSLSDDIEETGFRETGLLNLAETEDELTFFKTWLGKAQGHIAPETRILSPDEIAAKYPTLTQRYIGGLYAPSDGSAEPVLASTMLAEAARRHGAKIVTGCAVRGLDIRNGRIEGVFTERGTVRCKKVVCAAHTWTRLLLGNHGIDIPQIYAIMSMGRSTVVDGPQGSGGTSGWAWRRQIDGTYSLGGMISIVAPLTRDLIKLGKLFKPLMEVSPSGKLSFGQDSWNDFRLARRWNPKKASPFEKLRVLSGKIVSSAATISLNRNVAAFPEMSGASVTEEWAGSITITPDGKPIIGSVDSVQGLSVVTGTGYGITWGPAVGQLMAEHVMGEPTSIDLHPFRLSRFTDGSPLEIAH